MRKIIIVFLFFTFLFTLASGQSWYWTKAGYTIGYFGAPEVEFAVAADANHNAYITGAFPDTMRFGSIVLSSNSINAYLVKYDSGGNALWAVQPIDSGIGDYSMGLSVACDKFGNIFVTGDFKGTIKFGSYRLTGSPYYQDAFIVKYSPSGNVLWAKQSNSVYEAISYAVATDDSGNAYITGFFGSKTYFGSDTINNSHESFDVFLIKYDSSGNVLWAKQSNVPSAASYGWGYSLATDKIGNTYITGQFLDTISFGSITLLSPKTASTYIVKYSSAGDVIWAKQSTNNTINSESWPNNIILTNTNNLYLTGFFVDAVKFGSQSLYSPSTNSVFLTKYDTGGNFVWAKQSSVGWYGQFLASDNMNHIYLSGLTNNNPDTLKFGGYQLYTSHNVSIASFLIEFDSSGIPVCGSILNDVYAAGIVSDSTGNYVYSTGVFYGTVVFEPDTFFGTNTDEDVFTGRWQNCSVITEINSILPDKLSTSVYPNPNTGIFQLEINNYELGMKCSVEVYNLLGEQVLTEALRSALGDNTINLENQPNGIYLYRVVTENGSLMGEGKVIIQK